MATFLIFLITKLQEWATLLIYILAYNKDRLEREQMYKDSLL